MKRTIAIVLAMLMVLSAVPLAFAENETNSTEESAEDVPEAGDAADGEDDTEEGAVDEVDDASPETGDSEDAGNETSEEDVEVDETSEEDVEVEDEAENETEAEPEEEEEEEDLVEIPENVTQEAGITPDSPLWGLERAIERISLSLTFGRSAKAKKGLAHARERLMEVQAMIAAKKMEKAGEAQEAYEGSMKRVREHVEALGNGDAIGELEDAAEIGQALAENEAVVEQANRLKAKVKAKGLTAEQESRLNAVMGSLGNSTESLKASVQEKMDRTKIKIKAKGGLSDDEVNEIASRVEQAVASGRKSEIKIKNRAMPGNSEEESEVEIEYEPEEDEESESEEIEAGKSNSRGKRRD